MKTTPHKTDQNRNEQDLLLDPVWNLLRQSPATMVSPEFADRVVVAARHADSLPTLFWSRARVAIASVAAMAAALVIAATWVLLPDPAPVLVDQGAAAVDAFAPLDEVASQEMLLAATDHLGEFSDTELVSLIGF